MAEIRIVAFAVPVPTMPARARRGAFVIPTLEQTGSRLGAGVK